MAAIVGPKAAVTSEKPAQPWRIRRPQGEPEFRDAKTAGKPRPSENESGSISGSYFAAVGKGCGLSESEFR